MELAPRVYTPGVTSFASAIAGCYSRDLENWKKLNF
jgi:hypothetical protein